MPGVAGSLNSETSTPIECRAAWGEIKPCVELIRRDVAADISDERRRMTTRQVR